MTRALPLLLGVATAALLLGGCRSGERRPGGPGAVRATDSGPGSRPAPPAGTERPIAPSSGAEVRLTNEDLAPVDAYIKRRVWYVGDEVEVVASREMFWQYVSFAAGKGVVEREDVETPDGLVVSVGYVGAKTSLSEATAPRALIGTGITVSARRRLVVRFVKTRDPNVPVRLRIAATGNAATGRGTETVHRGEEQIVVGCALVRRADGTYEYQEQQAP